MADVRREVVINGIGIVSSLGEGLEAHWSGLNAVPVAPNEITFAPCIAHPIVPIDFDKQMQAH